LHDAATHHFLAVQGLGVEWSARHPEVGMDVIEAVEVEDLF